MSLCNPCAKCGHPQENHAVRFGQRVCWAYEAISPCQCHGFVKEEDPDPYRNLPDCRCGHSAWVHLNEDGEQVRRCPGLRDGPPCGCARYSPGPRIRNAKICLCGHFVTDHGAVKKIGIIDPVETFMSPGAAFFINGNFRRGPITWGCTLCGCQGDGRNPPRPVLCCGLEEDHEEGLGCKTSTQCATHPVPRATRPQSIQPSDPEWWKKYDRPQSAGRPEVM